MIEIKLNKWARNRAERFADARCGDSDLYKKRGNFKRDDIVTGAMGELAVYELLHDCGIEVSEPDFEIYEARNKSFESDMTDGTRHFHVKAQNLLSAKRYGSSWLMQKTDPIIKNPKKSHYLVLTNVNLDNNIVTIYGCVPVQTIVNNNLFGKLVIPYLNKTKVALYLREITQALTKKRLWSTIYEEVKEDLL